MSPRAILALLIVLALAAVGGGAAFQQYRIHSAQKATEAAKAKYAAALVERDVARIERDAAQRTTRVVTEYVDRVQKVYVAGNTITKEIPIYVTTNADAACSIPVGFVRVHDAAAANVPLEPAPGGPDAPAAGVTLSAVAEAVAGNYTACHAIREQLISLQGWLSEPTSQ